MGLQKMVIEKLLNDLFANFPESWRIANLDTNPIGAHESGLIGENPLGIPNNIFPFLTKGGFWKFKRIKDFWK